MEEAASSVQTMKMKSRWTRDTHRIPGGLGRANAMEVDARGILEEMELTGTRMVSVDIHLMCSSTTISERMEVEVGSSASKYEEEEGGTLMLHSWIEAVEAEQAM